VSDEEETRRTSVRTLIEEALAAVVAAVKGMTPGAKARELRAKADSFARVLQQWDSAPPSSAQQEALRELVFHLHEKALHEKTVEADVRRRSITPIDGVRAHTPPPKKPRP
jgi:hypothetical protein